MQQTQDRRWHRGRQLAAMERAENNVHARLALARDHPPEVTLSRLQDQGHLLPDAPFLS